MVMMGDRYRGTTGRDVGSRGRRSVIQLSIEIGRMVLSFLPRAPRPRGVLALALLATLLTDAVWSPPEAAAAGTGPSTLIAWGKNTDGQVGDGTTTFRDAPVEIAGMDDIVAVAAGWAHSLALRSDGRVYAWGANGDGQLGDGTRDERIEPILIPGLTHVTRIAAGGRYSLAVRSDGSVWQWGARETGDPATRLGDLTVPTPVGIAADGLGTGAGHRLAWLDGEVTAWGDNDQGQLGDGTTTDRWPPAPFLNPDGAAIDADGGLGHSVVLLDDGSVRAIGDNANGQLGDGSFDDATTLVQVSGIDDAVDVAAGDLHTLALRGDGTVWTWGQATFGQLGDDTFDDRATPAVVPGLTGVTAIEAGGTNALAIAPAGLYVWGWMTGVPDKPVWGTPLLLDGTAGATDAAGGSDHGLVLLNGVPLDLPDPVATTLEVAASANPSLVDESVDYTFTVTPAPDMGAIEMATAPGGPFTAVADLDPSNGTATWSRSHGSHGTFPLWFRFGGVPGFLGSGTNLQQVVNRRPTTTSAVPGATVLEPDQSLTIAATVDPAPSDGGFARVAEDGNWLTPKVSVDPVTGEAELTVSGLSPGGHDLVVTFLGSDQYAPSTSPVMSVSVNDDGSPIGSVVIDAGDEFTRDPLVRLWIGAVDTSGVQTVSISNDGATWFTAPYTGAMDWSLEDPAGGGSAVNGIRTVRVRWTDAQGNTSGVASDSIVFDTVAPTATMPNRSLVAGGQVTTTGRVPMRFTWTGSDTLSGLARFELSQRTDTGSWVTVDAYATVGNVIRLLSTGHEYRFRVRAVDHAGNAGPWETNVAFRLYGYQESSIRLTWSTLWHTAHVADNWGGHDRYSLRAGAQVRFTFRGRQFAWVAPTGPTRGAARIYVNGRLVATVSLYSATPTSRKIVWLASWPTQANRTITIRVVGTRGRPRIDLDAVMALQ
jgi:alpha-tubulin suppressor-like RCC1 family protein